MYYKTVGSKVAFHCGLAGSEKHSCCFDVTTT